MPTQGTGTFPEVPVGLTVASNTSRARAGEALRRVSVLGPNTACAVWFYGDFMGAASGFVGPSVVPPRAGVGSGLLRDGLGPTPGAVL